MNQINLKKVTLFLALTFFFSWIILPIYFAFGGKFVSPVTTFVLLGYMFVPMTMAIVVQKFIYHEPLQEPLGIALRKGLPLIIGLVILGLLLLGDLIFVLFKGGTGMTPSESGQLLSLNILLLLPINFLIPKWNRWVFLAWFLPAILGIAAFGANLLIPGVQYSPTMEGMFERFAKTLTPEQLQAQRDSIATLPLHPFWLTLINGLIAGITINAVAAFGEELGWRGLLQKELEPLGFWKSALAIGIIWGIWHAPIILQGYNYPDHPQIGVLFMTIFTTLFTPLIMYARLKSQSVIAAAIMHGSLNGTAGLSFLLIYGGNDLTNGILGLAGFIVMGIANLILYFSTRKNQAES